MRVSSVRVRPARFRVLQDLGVDLEGRPQADVLEVTVEGKSVAFALLDGHVIWLREEWAAADGEALVGSLVGRATACMATHEEVDRVGA